MGPLQALSPLALPPLHIAILGTGEINSRSAEVDVHQRLSDYCLHLPRTTEGKGERATLPVRATNYFRIRVSALPKGI